MFNVIILLQCLTFLVPAIATTLVLQVGRPLLTDFGAVASLAPVKEVFITADILTRSAFKMICKLYPILCGYLDARAGYLDARAGYLDARAS